MTNPFTEQYKELSNSELLSIVDNADDYQKLAVEAAQLEIDNRKLSSEELMEAREQQTKTKHGEIVKIIDDKIFSLGPSFIELFKPIRKEGTSRNLFIIIICMLLIAYFIFQGITSILARGPIIINTEFFIWISYPTTAFFFWRRTKIGWILLSILLTGNLFLTLYLTTIEYNILNLGDMLLYGVALYINCIKSTRDIYNINKRTMLITLFATIAITTLIWNLLLSHYSNL